MRRADWDKRVSELDLDGSLNLLVQASRGDLMLRQATHNVEHDLTELRAELARLEDIVDQVRDWVRVDEYPPMTKYFGPLVDPVAEDGDTP